MNMFKGFKNLIFICLSFFPLEILSSESVIGCGGFLKSASASLKDVKVQLLTRDGVVRYETDCAPHNGYYFLPVYNNGNYIVKVVASAGWSFTPDHYQVVIDGQSDVCSRGEDLNFVFDGFSITGQVVTRGSVTGPAGVTLTLVPSGADTDKQSTLTGADGRFSFSSVSPGAYKVVASHSTWRLALASVSTTVTSANVDVGASLTVVGYDVTGQVRDLSGVPLDGATVFLHSLHSIDGQCDGHASSLPVSSGQLPPARCSVLSDSGGRFLFPAVPNGQYSVSARYSSASTQFQWSPAHLTLTVNNNNTALARHLQISGFSVSGRLVLADDTAAVKRHLPDVADTIAVLLAPLSNTAAGASGGAAHARTAVDSTGNFHFDNVRPALYQVSVECDWARFAALRVELSVASARVPQLVASEFRVCGLVELSQLPDTAPAGSRRVEFERSESGHVIGVSTDQRGHFCTFLAAGVYRSRVTVSDDEVRRGLHFGSSSSLLHVSGSAVLQQQQRQLFVRFSAVGGRVHGTVTCLSRQQCSEQPMLLLLVGEQQLPQLSAQAQLNDSSSSSSSSSSGDADQATTLVFEFDNVPPGQYHLSVTNKPDWCWLEESVPVTVSADHDPPVPLVQSGWRVTVDTSHSTRLQYRAGKSSQSDSATNAAAGGGGASSLPATVVTLTAGTNQLCVPGAAVYTLDTLSQCHVFADMPRQLQLPPPAPLSPSGATVTAAAAAVELAAVAHRVTAAVMLPPPPSDGATESWAVELIAVDSADKQLPPAAAASSSSSREHCDRQADRLQCSWFAAAGQLVTVRAVSQQLVFTPAAAQVSLLADDRCGDERTDSEPSAVLHAARALFVTGSVTPAVAGVLVSVTGDSEAAADTLTNSDGLYSIGPLQPGVSYDVTASMEGYDVTPVVAKHPNHDRYRVERHFRARQLSRLQVQCVLHPAGDRGDHQQQQGSTDLALAGVLVTVSGESGFRDNRLTDTAGRVVYSALSSGRLFVRAMLSEYQFEPSSAFINVSDGQSSELVFRGRRVLFSLVAQVVALAGHAEPGVLVQAAGVGACAAHVQHANSDTDGAVVVRALRPGCEYVVSVRASGEVTNTAADSQATSDSILLTRALPATQTIKVPADGGDVRGVTIRVLRAPSDSVVTVSGRVTGRRDVTGLWLSLTQLAVSDHHQQQEEAGRQEGQNSSARLLHQQRLSSAVFTLAASLAPSGHPHVLRLQTSGDPVTAVTLDSVVLAPSVRGHFVELVARQRGAGATARATGSSPPPAAALPRPWQSSSALLLLLVLAAAGGAWLFRQQLVTLWQQADGAVAALLPPGKPAAARHQGGATRHKHKFSTGRLAARD